MAHGYFIGKGDKTSCGGTVLEGDSQVLMFGLLHSREGDAVSCGENGETYQIIGGVDSIRVQGRRVAGTLDSVSSCPCGATLLASVTQARYGSTNSAPPVSRSAPPSAAPTAEPAVAEPEGAVPRRSGRSAMKVDGHPEPQEPGFYVVPKSTTREALIRTLFHSPSPGVLAKFMTLNPDRGLVKAGTLIVVSDPNNHQCTQEEALLMEAAAYTVQALESISAEEADFMMRHRDEIETFIAHSATAAGIGVAIFADNIANVKTTLKKIEELHQQTYLKDGHLRSPEFFAARKQLMSELDNHMTRLTRRLSSFPDHPNLKHALGISSKSLVHRWTQAGASGQIPGYATHMRGVARGALILKTGGWLVTALGGVSSVMKVQDVCRAGVSEACRRVKFTQTGSFMGALAGGAVASSIGGGLASGICVGIAIPTAGTGGLICGALVIGGGALVAGIAGSYVGEGIGEVIHETTR